MRWSTPATPQSAAAGYASGKLTLTFPAVAMVGTGKVHGRAAAPPCWPTTTGTPKKIPPPVEVVAPATGQVAGRGTFSMRLPQVNATGEANAKVSPVSTVSTGRVTGRRPRVRPVPWLAGNMNG